MNKVSIVVLCYGCEQYLHTCIRSIDDQTHQDIEVILVNDGCIDRSLEICEEFARSDQRVQIILKENGGPSSARKAGIEAAHGDYLMFIDGDDWLDPETIETCLKVVQHDPEVDCVLFSYSKESGDRSSPMHLYDESREFDRVQFANQVYRRLFGLADEELKHPERMENIVSCCMKLYRMDLAKRGKFYHTAKVGSCEDGLFNMYALYGCHKAVYIDRPYYHYRKMEGTLTSSYRPHLPDQWKYLYHCIGKVIEEKNLDSTYRIALRNRIALSITAISLNELKNTNHNVLGHVQVIRSYLKRTYYHKAVRRMPLNTLPFTWKCLMICCRMKLAWPIYIAMRIVNRIKWVHA